MVACIILSVVRSVVIAVVVALAIMLLWGMFFRPRETFGLLMFGLMMQLLEQHAGACIAAASCLLCVGIIADRRSPP